MKYEIKQYYAIYYVCTSQIKSRCFAVFLKQLQRSGKIPTHSHAIGGGNEPQVVFFSSEEEATAVAYP